MLASPGRESRKNGLHVGRGEIARASVAIGLPNIPDHYWNAALETAGGAGTSLGSRPPGFPSGPRGAPQDAIRLRRRDVASGSSLLPHGAAALRSLDRRRGLEGVASKLHPSASRTGSKTRCAVLGHFRQKAGKLLREILVSSTGPACYAWHWRIGAFAFLAGGVKCPSYTAPIIAPAVANATRLPSGPQKSHKETQG